MVKPPPTDQVTKRISEEELDKVINMGAPVKEDLKIEENKPSVTKVKKEKKKKPKIDWILVPIRMTKEVLESIDKEIKRRIGTSRNGWVLEAIRQKMEREGINFSVSILDSQKSIEEELDREQVKTSDGN